VSFVHSPPVKRRWISLTPLIDVVFILLMFFMLTTQFYRTGFMNISVASAPTGDAATSDLSVKVTVLANNVWMIGAQTYLESNPDRLARSVQGKDVTVYAADSSTLQDVVSMLDLLADSGASSAVWRPDGNQAVPAE